MRTFAASLEGFKDRRVTVVGDAMLDGYLQGFAERVCREAPVPVVRLESQHYTPGGASNMAANLAAMGATVRFVSVVGDDEDATILRESLASLGVDCSAVIADRSRETIAKRRLVADGQQIARFDTGSMNPIASETAERVSSALATALEDADVLVISDYRCGVLSDQVIAALPRILDGSAALVVVDSTNLSAYRQIRPDLVKPSLSEALMQLSLTPAPPESRPELAQALGDGLLDMSGARHVALTLDEDGAIVFTRDGPPLHTPARFHGTAHPAGAGDTYLAAFSLALASALPATRAAEVAAAAAGVVVATDGTSLCSLPELLRSLGLEGQHKVCAIDQLAGKGDELRSLGKSIVFTNGCFDLLHPGHIALLEHARRKGDILVVGVNSDASVRALKGEGRPVNELSDRLRVLAALASVDVLVPFDDQTADTLLEALRPHIYVKGGDYAATDIPEAATAHRVGAAIELVPCFGTESTSGLIGRIRGAVVEQAS